VQLALALQLSLTASMGSVTRMSQGLECTFLLASGPPPDPGTGRCGVGIPGHRHADKGGKRHEAPPGCPLQALLQATARHLHLRGYRATAHRNREPLRTCLFLLRLYFSQLENV